MTVLVESPLALYQAFIGRCGLDSREYGVLRNAIIAHVPKYLRDGNVATLLCTEDDANLLIGRAKQFYPQVVYYFEEALRSPAYRKAEFGDTSHPAPSNTKTLGAILFADSFWVSVAWITVALIGVNGARAIFWTIPPRFLSGMAAAGGLAFINSIGTTGGQVGPTIVGWLRDVTGSFSSGLLALSGFLVMAALMALSLKLVVKRGPDRAAAADL